MMIRVQRSLTSNTRASTQVISIEYIPHCQICSVSSILVSRFILDLRSIYTFHPDDHRATQSTISFACRITGNIGAPLAEEPSLWVNAAENTLDPEVVFSKEPFYEGLVPIEETWTTERTVET